MDTWTVKYLILLVVFSSIDFQISFGQTFFGLNLYAKNTSSAEYKSASQQTNYGFSNFTNLLYYLYHTHGAYQELKLQKLDEFDEFIVKHSNDLINDVKACAQAKNITIPVYTYDPLLKCDEKSNIKQLRKDLYTNLTGSLQNEKNRAQQLLQNCSLDSDENRVINCWNATLNEMPSRIAALDAQFSKSNEFIRFARINDQQFYLACFTLRRAEFLGAVKRLNIDLTKCASF